jgi:predicted TIM-barrel fold metal-dependent hydrolase
MSRLMIISSDGHAMARMEEYAAYMDPKMREEFGAFVKVYQEKGTRTAERGSLSRSLDPDEVDRWVRDYVDAGRLEGTFEVARRLPELEREGVCGEVLLPDFGLPFELYNPSVAAVMNHPPRTFEQVDAGNRAHNRWLADFCSQAPERFAGMASIAFDDPAEAVRQIHAAKKAGLKGVMIPLFSDEVPLYDARFDPVWSTLEDLDLPANSHTGTSGTTRRVPYVPSPPHPSLSGPMYRPVNEFYTHMVLVHLIWGGVLERHPRLKVVFTEQGSGWVPGRLTSMDYSYEGSYMRRDVREVVKVKPSEYFARQCWIGSSLLSRAEIAARHQIGVDKMMIGVDYPHHEGTWNGGNLDYLQATLGAERVPENEARLLLGETAAKVFGFDTGKLAPIVDRIGPTPQRILTPPTEDKFPRGDVHKPLAGNITR